MKLVNTSRPTTKRERLMQEFVEWDDAGRQTVPTARLMAGMYAVRYRQRYHMMPMSAVQDDLESFDAMLALLDSNKSLAPYCIDVLFQNKDFNVNSTAFSNPNILDKWNVVEKADRLRMKDGRSGGEQAEFTSQGSKKYGVIRV